MVTIQFDGYVVVPTSCVSKLMQHQKWSLKNDTYLAEYPWMEYAAMHIAFTATEHRHLHQVYEKYRCFHVIHDAVRKVLRWKFSNRKNRYLSVDSENMLQNIDRCVDILQWCGRYLVEGKEFTNSYVTNLKVVWRILQHLPYRRRYIHLQPLVRQMTQCTVNQNWSSADKPPPPCCELHTATAATAATAAAKKIEVTFSPDCCKNPPTANELIRILDDNIQNAAADRDMQVSSVTSTVTRELQHSTMPQLLLLLYRWVTSSSGIASSDTLVRHTQDTWQNMCDFAQLQEAPDLEERMPEDFWHLWREDDHKRWARRSTASAGIHYDSLATCEEQADRGHEQFVQDCAGSQCAERATQYRDRLLALCQFSKKKPVLPHPLAPNDLSALQYLAQYDEC